MHFVLIQMNMGVSSSSVESQDKPQIRKCVVLGILDSEHMYVDCLDVLLQVSQLSLSGLNLKCRF